MIRVITLILIIVICLCLYYKLYKKREGFLIENIFSELIELKGSSLPEKEKIILRLNKFFINL